MGPQALPGAAVRGSLLNMNMAGGAHQFVSDPSQRATVVTAEDGNRHKPQTARKTQDECKEEMETRVWKHESRWESEN